MEEVVTVMFQCPECKSMQSINQEVYLSENEKFTIAVSIFYPVDFYFEDTWTQCENCQCGLLIHDEGDDTCSVSFDGDNPREFTKLNIYSENGDEQYLYHFLCKELVDLGLGHNYQKRAEQKFHEMFTPMFKTYQLSIKEQAVIREYFSEEARVLNTKDALAHYLLDKNGYNLDLKTGLEIARASLTKKPPLLAKAKEDFYLTSNPEISDNFRDFIWDCIIDPKTEE